MAGKWCGPYAFSIATQQSYEQAYEFAKKKLRKRSIMGMYNHQMKALMRACGFKKFEFEYLACKPTLRSFKDWMKPNRLYIVVVTGHYVTVDTSNWTVICNQTQEWQKIDECKHRLRKVKAYAEVKRIEKAGE
jgi:hypothetical protein